MSTMGRRKCIIDVDTGVDDAQALILALSCPDIDVVAVTCVAGNVGVEQVCRNTLTVLTVCNRLDIPVYKGASKSLIGDCLRASHYHGEDGLGEANLDIAVDPGSQLQKEHAVTALTRIAKKFPGEITLIALAPLTNIALAVRMDPDFGKNLKNVLVMGGNIEGRGNSTVSGEFNFAVDPEAAYVVLKELDHLIELNALEISLTSAAGQPWTWYDEWTAVDTVVGRFNRDISKKLANIQRLKSNRPIYRSCDLNAMATFVDPDVVVESEEVFASVELAGNLTRGQMVVDWRGILGKAPNVRLIKKLDTEKTRKLFDEMLTHFT